MPDVFISYKREDEARVGRLVAALKAHGLDVWWDQDIRPGAPWEATIERTLNQAKAVIVCWSKTAVGSDNVRSEARHALGRERLIQVFVDDCEPPLFFGERQGLDLRGWQGTSDDPQIMRLAEAARAIAEGRAAELPSVMPPRRLMFGKRALLACLGLALLLAMAAGWFLLRPGEEEGPVTLAVLPFRSLSQADANLSVAIADDTRDAIGRNPQLRVLGRLAVTALADKGLSPKDYRRKVGADYLLDGSVQRVGPQVRIKVSLVRTEDGAEVWNDQLGGKLDDVFAFQSQIASEVEGRIRGRLAPGQGIKPENITTSGAVYSIYADAKAHIYRRNPDDLRQGMDLLKKAVAADPNYAPAWAQLGIAAGLLGPHGGKPMDEMRKEAVGYLDRALTLAPNLAIANAGLSMVQGNPPEARPGLLKAVELDPNNAEIWMWLGNMYGGENRVKEALAAHRRANEIEPLWISPIGNMLNDLSSLGDDKGIDELVSRVGRTGDPVLLAKAQFGAAVGRGRYGEAVAEALRLRTEHPEEQSYIDTRVDGNLIMLGFVEEAYRISKRNPTWISTYSGSAPSAGAIRSTYSRPAAFWLEGHAAAVLGRLLPRHGRLREYVGYYNAAFGTPGDFYNLSPSAEKGLFTALAPAVASNLRAAGQIGDANEILALDERQLQKLLKNGPANGDLLQRLAQLRAAQGRDVQAVKLIERAVALRWLPDRQYFAIDIAEEPAYARLLQRADFQALRGRIFARIDAERRIAAPAVAAAKL